MGCQRSDCFIIVARVCVKQLNVRYCVFQWSQGEKTLALAGCYPFFLTSICDMIMVRNAM